MAPLFTFFLSMEHYGYVGMIPVMAYLFLSAAIQYLISMPPSSIMGVSHEGVQTCPHPAPNHARIDPFRVQSEPKLPLVSNQAQISRILAIGRNKTDT